MLVFEHWNYYSMLLLKVRKVKRSGTDYCLSVPLSILPGLNADQLTRSGLVVILIIALCERLTSGVVIFIITANGRSYIRL